MCTKAGGVRQVVSEVGGSVCSADQCLAINNIEFVMSYINPFVSDLGIEAVLARLEEQKGGLAADACRKTIRTLVKVAQNNMAEQDIRIGTTH